jgi:hypothetical protein
VFKWHTHDQAKSESPFKLHSTVNESRDRLVKEALGIWAKIVVTYPGRQLSRSEDKLVAISAC